MVSYTNQQYFDRDEGIVAFGFSVLLLPESNTLCAVEGN